MRVFVSALVLCAVLALVVAAAAKKESRRHPRSQMPLPCCLDIASSTSGALALPPALRCALMSSLCVISVSREQYLRELSTSVSM